MNEQELREALGFAVECAQLAGGLTLGYFRAELTPELKADNTPVTVADRQAEELLRRRIEGRYPEHGILGEEHGEKPGKVPARWILDPIDGTISFVCGVPLYAVLIGLEWEGEMVVGALHLPALAETFYAGRGLGCYCNGRPTRVSEVRELSQARLTHTSARSMYEAGRGTVYERLREACALERGWSDAYGYALLAAGRVEVVLDPKMCIWDNAALVPIVTEAGGTFTDWSGRATHTSPEALATNGHVYQQVMELVRG